MANEQGIAHVDNLNLWFRFVYYRCIANESAHASLLEESSNEGETPACHVQSFIQGVLPRVAFLGTGCSCTRPSCFSWRWSGQGPPVHPTRSNPKLPTPPICPGDAEALSALAAALQRQRQQTGCHDIRQSEGNTPCNPLRPFVREHACQAFTPRT